MWGTGWDGMYSDNKSRRRWLSIDVWRSRFKLKGRESGNNMCGWHQPPTTYYTLPCPCFYASIWFKWRSCVGELLTEQCVYVVNVWDGREWKSGRDKREDGNRTYATRRQVTMMRRWSRQWSRQWLWWLVVVYDSDGVVGVYLDIQVG